MIRLLIAGLIGCLGGAGVARAEAALGLLNPATGPEALLTVPAATGPGHLEWRAGVHLDAARDILVGVSSQGRLARPVADRVGAGAWIELGLFGHLDLALALPAALAQRADGYPWPGDGGGPGLGDLRLLARGSALRRAGEPGLGLGVQVEVTLPTATGAPLLGERGLTATPWLLVDWRSAGGHLVALRAGYLLRPSTRFEDLRFDDEVRAGLGAEIPLGWRRLSTVAEVTAGVGLGEAASPDRRIPIEVAGALRWRPTSGAVLSLGATGGLSNGYGTPSVRGFVAVAFGASDPATVPGAGPDGPPPIEPDGAPGPRPPASGPLTAAAFDRAVAGQPDADRDGLVAPEDACPAEPEDPDGFQDDDGCPDPDDDRDGVADAADRCPREAETINGVEDHDGCPDTGAPAVTVTPEAVQLDQRVRFTTGSAEVDPGSLGLLAQVAAVLKAHPEIRRVRIEGHTDDVGDREQNVDLSQRRAERVAAVLVGQGVAAERLEPRGFGSKAPLGPNRTEEERALNRRVEFIVVDVPTREVAP